MPNPAKKLFLIIEKFVTVNIRYKVAQNREGGVKYFSGTLFLLLAIINIRSIYSWTWLYNGNATDFINSNIINNEIVLSKLGSQLFSQLIFSWNADRPSKGYFSFSVQVRDSITKRWYPWHQMAKWGQDGMGKNIQQSLTSKTPRGTQFHYVRLELPSGRLADAFRLKIKMHNNAKIQDLKQIFINLVNRDKFVSEVGVSKIKQLTSVHISGVPKLSQMQLNHPLYDKLCSPTSVSMLIGFLLKKKFDPHLVAKGVFDEGLKAYGSWPFNMAHAYELCEGKYTFHVERLDSFKTIHEYLSSGMPVVVSVRGPLSGGATPYTHGHLLVVVGYNKRSRKVICHDPAFASNAKTKIAYNLDDFLTAWERSFRLSYITHKV